MAQRLQPPTKSGLLPEATHLVLPDGIVATGFPATDATCRRIGILFDPWQEDLNRCILAKESGGLYAADTVAMSIPRQVGKTYDVGGVVFADSIINEGTTTVWTAHRFKVARESFNEMRAWAKSPLLKPHIDYDDITTAAGNECIPFRNGSRILFAARERGAIRGFTKVRRLVLDEGQILTEHALADLVPTMNQAENPQIIVMGTPPKPTDPSEVFTRLRADALSGDSEGVLYVEFSASPGVDPGDRDAWRKANPSYPTRTPAKAILRMRKLLSADDFMREALGIWDDENASGLFDLTVWRDLADAESQPSSGAVFGIDVTPDHAWSSLALSGRRADKLMHVDVDDVDGHRRGTAWVVERCTDLAKRYKGAGFVIDGGGPGKSLIPALEAAGLMLTVMATGDVTAACGLFVDAVAERTLRHRGQLLLDAAVAGAQPRPVGDGPIAFGRKKSDGDISPLNAACFAHWAAATSNYDVLRSVW